jgi:hypothetical protein
MPYHYMQMRVVVEVPQHRAIQVCNLELDLVVRIVSPSQPFIYYSPYTVSGESDRRSPGQTDESRTTRDRVIAHSREPLSA